MVLDHNDECHLESDIERNYGSSSIDREGYDY